LGRRIQGNFYPYFAYFRFTSFGNFVVSEAVVLRAQSGVYGRDDHPGRIVAWTVRGFAAKEKTNPFVSPRHEGCCGDEVFLLAAEVVIAFFKTKPIRSGEAARKNEPICPNLAAFNLSLSVAPLPKAGAVNSGPATKDR
jgi:hypothetical protein